MQMSEANFTKHVYDKKKKREVKPLEGFDPRPLEFRGTAGDRLPALLQNIGVKTYVCPYCLIKTTVTGTHLHCVHQILHFLTCQR